MTGRGSTTAGPVKASRLPAPSPVCRPVRVRADCCRRWAGAAGLVGGGGSGGAGAAARKSTSAVHQPESAGGPGGAGNHPVSALVCHVPRGSSQSPSHTHIHPLPRVLSNRRQRSQHPSDQPKQTANLLATNQPSQLPTGGPIEEPTRRRPPVRRRTRSIFTRAAGFSAGKATTNKLWRSWRQGWQPMRNMSPMQGRRRR